MCCNDDDRDCLPGLHIGCHVFSPLRDGAINLDIWFHMLYCRQVQGEHARLACVHDAVAYDWVAAGAMTLFCIAGGGPGGVCAGPDDEGSEREQLFGT